MTDVPTARRLEGPAPSLLPAGFDLADHGFVEEEYVLEGESDSYRLAGERTADGKWHVEPDGSARYRTRVLVRRPIDPDAFSGTVLVEWLNVSGGVDASPEWMYLHRQLMRRGDAWVGVSAQKAGIDGGGLVQSIHLKALAPDRYELLDHPGDAYSYDIFTRTGRLLRTDPGAVLGPLVPTRLLAGGESQSAMHLTSYINAVDALSPMYDGFLVHGRSGNGAGFNVSGATGMADIATIMAGLQHGEAIRDDARVPVIVLQSETDVVFMASWRAEQRDSDRVRLWEVAGAAHADTYLLKTSHHDGGQLAPEAFAKLLRPVTELLMFSTSRPINAGPQQHYVAHAAFEHLDRWAAGGPAPPSAERLELTDARDECVRDPDGLARGGVRTPWVEVPLLALSGLGQTGEAFAVLFGTSEPLSATRLTELYPAGRDDFVAQFAASLDETIEAGFLLAADRDEILAVAVATYDATRG